MAHKDYFSTQAQRYLEYRPRYPDALFTYLLNGLPKNAIILDCATGNGQAASALSGRGHRVVGTDISYSQVSNASAGHNNYYVLASAEALPMQDNSVNLLTVAQALHWFQFEHFYREVKRVLTNDGIVAAWTYSLLAICDQLGEQIADCVRWFYHDIVGPYWPPERRWVDDEYRSIPFPFEDLHPPEFTIELTWTREQLRGYISSWSAVALYKKARQIDPLPLLDKRLIKAWPASLAMLDIRWPLALRVGKVAA